MKFAPGAWRYAIVPLVVAPFAYLISVGVGIATLLLGVGTLAFFRDPERTPPLSGVVAPADGKVSVVRTEGDRFRLGTFMNVHNVHVVRAPFDATVRDVEHSPGGFKPAFSKDSDRNEKVHLHLEPAEGAFSEGGLSEGALSEGALSEEAFSEGDDQSPEPGLDETGGQAMEAEVTFIAGAFARRIHPYVEPGDSLDRGQRIGHIAFGSRVDVVFPPSVDPEELAVEPGQKMTAGETVILETDGNLLSGNDGLDVDGSEP
ncbi:protein sorting system archaetidylserine decarboxylase [Natronosalvus halobius]|uniref:protein sorting system archaetidylserine decarboxylase n=1 Tax=Natronosalvus halobius TaxID=2953746 RepID=UPI00209D2A1F|nr:protein sorting system archaetidylserine decarboxylase [Natronosalvus halobius]USZ72161.1 protein sorting system archaetidylserine decarboxylase [Natronosalvus halobius]